MSDHIFDDDETAARLGASLAPVEPSARVRDALLAAIEEVEQERRTGAPEEAAAEDGPAQARASSAWRRPLRRGQDQRRTPDPEAAEVPTGRPPRATAGPSPCSRASSPRRLRRSRSSQRGSAWAGGPR